MTKEMISISQSSTSLTYVVIFQLHLHMVFISRSWFGLLELVQDMISFEFESVNWRTSWCHRGFNCLVCRQLSANFTVVTINLFAYTNCRWATHCLICFIPIVNHSWHTDLDYGSYRLTNLQVRLTAGVTGR
jgi:hypothetical protein